MGRPHVHRWRASAMRGVPYAVCVSCSIITLRPWWPRWIPVREDDRD